MKAKRLIALILALFTVLLLCVACSDSTDDNPASDTTTDSGNSDTLPEETTVPVDPTTILTVPDDLEFSKDGKSTDFNVFTWSNQTMWEWDADKYSGELLDDAIYDRRVKTEEKLKIKFNILKEPGDWDHRNTFIQKIDASVQAGSKAFDLVGQYTPAAAIGAMKGLYLNLKDVDNFNRDQVWWPGDVNEASAINGNLYFTTGDITPTLIRNMSTVMVNLDLAGAYGLDDVYDLVDSKKWTLEKIKEMTLNIVDTENEGDPYYGVTISNNVVFDSFFYSGGFRFVDNFSDGTIGLSKSIAGEKIINWFNNCHAFLFDNADVELLTIDKAFINGHSIMHFGQTSDIQNYLKDVTFDFAIAPFPMSEETQGQYYTTDGYWVSMYSVPTDVEATAGKSGAVMETLGYYSYIGVTPAFYQEAFQYRYLETEDNARMFDLLRNTLTFDTGRTFCDQIGCFSVFRDAAKDGGDWTSTYSSNNKIWGKAIEKIYTKLG